MVPYNGVVFFMDKDMVLHKDVDVNQKDNNKKFAIIRCIVAD